MPIPAEFVDSVAGANVKTIAEAGAYYTAQSFGAAAAAHQNGITTMQTGVQSFVSAMALMWKNTAELRPSEAVAEAIASSIANKVAANTPPAGTA